MLLLLLLLLLLLYGGNAELAEVRPFCGIRLLIKLKYIDMSFSYIIICTMEISLLQYSVSSASNFSGVLLVIVCLLGLNTLIKRQIG